MASTLQQCSITNGHWIPANSYPWLVIHQSYAQLTWAQEPATITGNDIEGEVGEHSSRGLERDLKASRQQDSRGQVYRVRIIVGRNCGVLNSRARGWKLQARRNCFCAWMRYHGMGMPWMHWLRMDSPSQICSALTSMSFVHLRSHFPLVTQTVLLLRSLNPLCTRLTWPCISDACSRSSLGVVFVDRSSFESRRGC